MWQDISEVPVGKTITAIYNPFDSNTIIWAEVIVTSKLQDVVVFTKDIRYLDNSMEISAICDKSTKCQICHKYTDNTKNVKIQYNNQDWLEYSSVCHECVLEFCSELLDDNNDITGFQSKNNH